MKSIWAWTSAETAVNFIFTATWHFTPVFQGLDVHSNNNHENNLLTKILIPKIYLWLGPNKKIKSKKCLDPSRTYMYLKCRSWINLQIRFMTSCSHTSNTKCLLTWNDPNTNLNFFSSSKAESALSGSWELLSNVRP